MKARLKTNFGEARKGQIFQVKEMFDRFAALYVNGQIADFGYSEIEIISESPSDDFFLGRRLVESFGKGLCLMRQTGIENVCKRITWPVKRSLASRAINAYLWC